MSSPLRQAATNYRQLRERLRREFPDADDQTLHDTLDGLSDLKEMLIELTRSYLDDRSLAKALKERMDDMDARLRRHQDRAARKKALIAEVMGYAEIRRLVEADVTVSLGRKAPALRVLDEAAVPPAYWVAPPPRLDRAALTAALKEGGAVPGAVLDNGGASLSLRTK